MLKKPQGQPYLPYTSRWLQNVSKIESHTWANKILKYLPAGR